MFRIVTVSRRKHAIRFPRSSCPVLSNNEKKFYTLSLAAYMFHQRESVKCSWGGFFLEVCFFGLEVRGGEVLGSRFQVAG